MAKLLVFLAIVAIFASVALATPAPRQPRPLYLDWGDRNDNFAGGVYYKCRDYWIIHAQARQLLVQNTSCPFGPFAADIVNHFIQDPSNVHIDGQDCGKWIEGNTGERGANKNPIEHAEVQATNRLMNCTLHPENCVDGLQTQAQNKTFLGTIDYVLNPESHAPRMPLPRFSLDTEKLSTVSLHSSKLKLDGHSLPLLVRKFTTTPAPLLSPNSLLPMSDMIKSPPYTSGNINQKFPALSDVFALDLERASLA